MRDKESRKKKTTIKVTSDNNLTVTHPWIVKEFLDTSKQKKEGCLSVDHNHPERVHVFDHEWEVAQKD